MSPPVSAEAPESSFFAELTGQDAVVAQLRRASAAAAALLAGDRPGGGVGGYGGADPPVRRRICGDVPPEAASRAR